MLGDDDRDWLSSVHARSKDKSDWLTGTTAPVPPDRPAPSPTDQEVRSVQRAGRANGGGDDHAANNNDDNDDDDDDDDELRQTHGDKQGKAKASDWLFSAAAGGGCGACAWRRGRVNRLQAENAELRGQLGEQQGNRGMMGSGRGLGLGLGQWDSFLQGSDERVQYYTGIHCYSLFTGLLQHVRPHLPDPNDADDDDLNNATPNRDPQNHLTPNDGGGAKRGSQMTSSDLHVTPDDDLQDRDLHSPPRFKRSPLQDPHRTPSEDPTDPQKPDHSPSPSKRPKTLHDHENGDHHDLHPDSSPPPPSKRPKPSSPHHPNGDHQGGDDLSSGDLRVFQRVLLALSRLRLALPLPHLSHLLGIEEGSEAATSFKETMGALYDSLLPLVYWPHRQCLLDGVPPEFGQALGLAAGLKQEQAVVIVTCVEVAIDRPSSMKGREQTYSAKRAAYTMKYLLALTPQGAVAFVSRAYGGRMADQQVLETSGLLDRLQCGDWVLAARGFDLEEGSNDIMVAQVRTSAFGGIRNRRQLDVKSREETLPRQHLQPTLEQVLGALQGWLLLEGTVPISMLFPGENDDPPLLDKIVTVCSALVNMCPTVTEYPDQ